MKHLAAVIATCCSMALVGGLLVGSLGGSAAWAYALGALLIFASLRQLLFPASGSRRRSELLLKAGTRQEEAGELNNASELFRHAAEECLSLYVRLPRMRNYPRLKQTALMQKALERRRLSEQLARNYVTTLSRRLDADIYATARELVNEDRDRARLGTVAESEEVAGEERGRLEEHEIVLSAEERSEIRREHEHDTAPSPTVSASAAMPRRRSGRRR